MRRIGSHGNYLKLKDVYFLLGSIYQGFLKFIFASITLQYTSAAHELWWTSEALAGLVETDSWTLFTVSDLAGTEEPAFLTISEDDTDATGSRITFKNRAICYPEKQFLCSCSD